ncbi:hypothetical protein BpHYR1_042794 [Brachionus plicatilis]|uniref:Uncharacterized protein n=1 Tax=Brachionus plicatilis TaxID=10195 RepID=A0A3M7SQH3_BRAPC|nr:hypothetical protein BpHYR1_042794 [Brachionus plicatilis]
MSFCQTIKEIISILKNLLLILHCSRISGVPSSDRAVPSQPVRWDGTPQIQEQCSDLTFQAPKKSSTSKNSKSKL